MGWKPHSGASHFNSDKGTVWLLWRPHGHLHYTRQSPCSPPTQDSRRRASLIATLASQLLPWCKQSLANFDSDIWSSLRSSQVWLVTTPCPFRSGFQRNIGRYFRECFSISPTVLHQTKLRPKRTSQQHLQVRPTRCPLLPASCDDPSAQPRTCWSLRRSEWCS